ncbi:GrpB family protein [Acuticoccus sp. M5D2P5]|uniref:GrpB family protein n=1 Tax=Acuticoccus kalidii TaxID=2910977 RepID=UPI001F1EAB62|nr:GrpB family protein [Acuticoccus kalidii]MCF3933040.1 GrpB family protein [Acuticoccus kalidii]
MQSEPPFMLVDPELARRKAERLFTVVRAAIVARLPEADIRHVGATAVPGCLTKGDLDIVVRVEAADFPAADHALGAHFARNDGSVRTDAFAAFADDRSDPPLGVQLVAIGGPLDVFHHFVEALRASPGLVAEYNALKSRFAGADMEVYRRAKSAFIEEVLARRIPPS